MNCNRFKKKAKHPNKVKNFVLSEVNITHDCVSFAYLTFIKYPAIINFKKNIPVEIYNLPV